MRLVCCGFLCTTFPEKDKQFLLHVVQFMRMCQLLLEFHNRSRELCILLLQLCILSLTQGGSLWNSRVTTQFNNLLCQFLLSVLLAPPRILLVLAALQAFACQLDIFLLVFGEAVVGNPLVE